MNDCYFYGNFELKRILIMPSFPFNLKHEMINLDHSDQKFGSFSSKYWSDQDNIDKNGNTIISFSLVQG